MSNSVTIAVQYCSGIAYYIIRAWNIQSMAKALDKEANRLLRGE